MALDLNLLISTTSEENNQRFTVAKQEVQTYLATLNKVKIFIADSRSFGHQSSSINIIFNLIRLGCNAEYTIIYENKDALNKLRVLLPINPDNIQPITLPNSDGTGTVNVKFLSFNSQQENCDLVLTGGYDYPVHNLSGLKGTYTIELQPYNWKQGGSENAIYCNATGKTINLDEQIKNFNGQAFYISDPTRDEDFWAKFVVALPTWAPTVNLTKAILDSYEVNDFLFSPAYGINTGSIDPILSLFNMCCGISYQQDRGDKRKAVIVSFSPKNQKGQDNDVDLNTLKTLIETGKYNGKSPIYQSSGNCENYRTASSLATRVKYYAGVTASELTNMINALEEKQILVVQIGPVPAPMFNYTYYIANLPFIFEGQNTATLAMNFGRAYIHLATPGTYDDGSLFPVLPNGNNLNNNLNGNIATMICSKMSNYPGNWRSSASAKVDLSKEKSRRPGEINQLSPAYVLGQYTYDTIYPDKENKQYKYFKKIGTFFHDEKYDKLLDALIYLNSNIINP